MKYIQHDTLAKFATFLMAVAPVGCGQQNGGSSQISSLTATPVIAVDQNSICATSTVEVAKNCKLGQKIVFLPPSFGNQQLPILFAAANCDLRYSVVATVGAVTCIFKPLESVNQPANPPESPVSAAGN
jgi:hypothetical protein